MGGLLDLLRGKGNTPTQNQMRDVEGNQSPGTAPPPKPKTEEDESERELRMKRVMQAFEVRQAQRKAAGQPLAGEAGYKP